MSELILRVEPTRFEVTQLPQDSENAPLMTLWVERRGKDRWCVTDGCRCYDANGDKQIEDRPTARTAKFKKRFRFPLDDALKLAERLVPTLTLNGRTAEQVWAWEQEQRRTRTTSGTTA